MRKLSCWVVVGSHFMDSCPRQENAWRLVWVFGRISRRDLVRWQKFDLPSCCTVPPTTLTSLHTALHVHQRPRQWQTIHVIQRTYTRRRQCVYLSITPRRRSRAWHTPNSRLRIARVRVSSLRRHVLSVSFERPSERLSP